MNLSKNCSFCQNKGIKGPHDHTIRDFSAKMTPIICPELLNINCTYCKEKGHTVNYCDVLKKKKQYRAPYIPNVKTNKRSINIDSDGFVTYKNYDRPIETNISIVDIYNIKKVQKVNILSSMFASLEVETGQVDDAINKDDNMSWVNIVLRTHKEPMPIKKKRWCDYEDDE